MRLFRPTELVVVEWQGPGALILKGKAHSRVAGDQDVTEYENVEGSIQSGKVKLLGLPSSVLRLGSREENDGGSDTN